MIDTPVARRKIAPLIVSLAGSAVVAVALGADAPSAAATPRLSSHLPNGFVDLSAVVPDIVVDLRYATDDNFVGRRINGYRASRCILTRRAAQALERVQHDLAERGLGLKVFDCYRPKRAVAHFVRWARDPADTAMKSKYYPQIDKRDLFKLGYIATRSGHSRGSTLDLTLVRTANGIALDMGTPFDFFSPKSWTMDLSITAEQQFNRRMLFEAMNRRGFRGYDKEWWHFTLANEPFPRTYFDFVVR
jgi:D-alanyl-D-alanine dipeptidase